MSKLLITGADGFIGSHLVEASVKSGHKVRAVVQYNSFGSWGWLDKVSKEILENVEVVPADIRDSKAMENAVRGQEAVMHLAALVAIPHSYAAPHSYIETNVVGTLNLLEAATKFGVERFLQTSTSEVYGSAQYVPIDEAHPIVGQSPYAASKIASDNLAYSYFASHGLPVTIVRPFNSFGPRQSMRAIIPTIIGQIASGSRDIRLGALHPTRDFTFVIDTANAFLATLESKKVVGETINFGSGFEISIKNLVELISKLMDAEIEIKLDSSRVRPDKSEVDRLFSSNLKARDLTSWAPTESGIVGFEKNLNSTINWFKNPVNLAHFKTGQYVT